MNKFQTILRGCLALALALGSAGCATTTSLQQKENLAIVAGFKVITPTKPDQKAILQQLSPGKVTPVAYKGKTYYVLPDLANNQAYVGGPTEYQAYQQLRRARQLNNETLQGAELSRAASMNWAGWGGWGAAAGLGGPPPVIPLGGR